MGVLVHLISVLITEHPISARATPHTPNIYFFFEKQCPYKCPPYGTWPVVKCGDVIKQRRNVSIRIEMNGFLTGEVYIATLGIRQHNY